MKFDGMNNKDDDMELKTLDYIGMYISAAILCGFVMSCAFVTGRLMQ